ncbi:MAG: TldD/PmbA family protein [Deltaproteobacteria bacterium]|nr:MAG: TldD/PmbA family protein [Deltaproteobacteria bacterium]
MTTSRRRLLQAGASLAAASATSHAWAAALPGARRPAPDAAPRPSDAVLSRLDTSELAAHVRLAESAVEAARKLGARYAEARLAENAWEFVGIRDRAVSRVGRNVFRGIGLRVLVGDGWGFAATGDLGRAGAAELARRAVEVARAQDAMRRAFRDPMPVRLAPVDAVTGRWVAPHEKDPLDVPVADKAALLVEAASRALEVPGVARVTAGVRSVREEKIVVTSDGVRVHQRYVRVFPQFTAVAVDRRRGRFESRAHEAPPMLAGWEYVEDLALVDDAPRIGEEAVQKLHAAVVEPGRMHVVLAPSNLWLVIHESIGHPTELDRAIGMEANFAGTSFLRPEDTGKRRIGSDIVHLVADRTQPGGLATTGWDDEGVPAGRWDIVRDGIFVGWQTTREQAAWIGESRSRGCAHADAFDAVTFQRMPNVSLQPGEAPLTTEDLIAATDRGVYVTGRGSWSIDHQRYNFQFGGQFFWEIENGRLTRPLRDVAYQANTVDFWSSCDMIGGPGTYRLGGTFSDGKGEPGQSNAVSHGCPPARFVANVLVAGGGH